MTIKLHAFTCGIITGPLGHMMVGFEGEITFPVPAYLIEHPKGRVLFDTGLHPGLRREPERRFGARRAQMFRLDFPAGAEVSARLEAIGRDPGKIDLIVSSHLHFDHVGGNALIPNATLLVQRREWEAGQAPDAAETRGFFAVDYDLGHKLRLVDGEHDVFGDGSVVCLPTPGHTPGHQSLKVRLDGGEVVLTADCCYFCQTLRERRLPYLVHDREQFLASLDKLAALERGGARLFFGHDPTFWKTVPQAPALVA
jgi:glyoxylase-like metal-dependent hydrolase (beta-lactamase superfamily II)